MFTFKRSHHHSGENGVRIPTKLLSSHYHKAIKIIFLSSLVTLVFVIYISSSHNNTVTLITPVSAINYTSVKNYHDRNFAQVIPFQDETQQSHSNVMDILYALYSDQSDHRTNNEELEHSLSSSNRSIINVNSSNMQNLPLNDLDINSLRGNQVKYQSDDVIVNLVPGGNQVKYHSDDDIVNLVPREYLYNKIQFLDNYKNPCWYQKMGKRLPKLQCLPYFFLAGMPKCGTTELYEGLISHPAIESERKEPHWWTRHRFDNKKTYTENARRDIAPLSDYIRLYDKTTVQLKNLVINGSHHHHIFGDGSASTFWDAHNFLSENGFPNFTSAHQIKYILPDAKILVIFRNPTDRLYSDYLYFHAGEQKSVEHFHTKVETAIDIMTRCFQRYSVRTCAYNPFIMENSIQLRIYIGLYSVFLQEWINVFGKEQIMVIRLEDYTTDEAGHLQKAARYLQLDPYPEKVLTKLKDAKIANRRRPKDRKVGSMLSKTKKLLSDFYQPFNDRLAEILKNTKYKWQ